jgi:hypothetical protein
MIARLRTAVVLLIGAAGLASAQTADLVPGDRATSAQLAQIVETTRAAGLPADPLFGMVNHGVQVHASPAVIVEAVRKAASRLRLAREFLGPTISDNDLLAAASAISEGANGESLRAIRDVNRNNRPLATPFGVLTQLLAEPLKTPLAKATQIVKDFVERDATSAQLVAFANNLNEDLATGMRGFSAVDARVRMLSAVLAPAGAAAAALTQDHAAAAAPGVRSGPPKRP